MKRTQALNSPFITLNDITLRVGDRLSFHAADWEIKTGQHWGILGANGSGKSLLTDVICRKIPIVRGRIQYFFDREAGKTRSYLKPGEILRISTEAHKELLNRHAGYHQARWQSFEGQHAPTVSELLTGKSIEHHSPFEVTPLKRSEDLYRQRREAAVTLLGIEYLLERKIIHVSHGEARKVLIARALMQSPELLILDDPFSGLDNASRALLRQTIEELFSHKKLHILLLTSRADEILKGITHLLCIEQGKLVAQGEKEALLKTDFVQQFLPQTQARTQRADIQFPLSSEMPEPPYTGSIVKMKKLSVRYGAVDVLQQIDWTMRSGEHWAILGHNGAGKSTLLSMILADNPQAYANHLQIFGMQRGSGESIWDIKQHIGWVSPELHIYYQRNTRCHTVVCSGFFDSVGLYRQYSNEQSDTASAWIASMGLEALQDRPLCAVSAGEQRMLLLARALVKNPRLLILDEPCQGLDAGHRSHILDLLDQLCRQSPVSIIYVTHHFREIPQAISHVLILEQGRVSDCGRRQEVLGC
ncbi:MAG: ATP-binding cassette domain-containing protein [bacterium]|nr:ATP-binding cassette domain-containing protein [bacterium]